MTIEEIYEELMGRRLAFQGAADVPPLYTNPIERVLIDYNLVEAYVSQYRVLPFTLQQAEDLLTHGSCKTAIGSFTLRPKREGNV